MPSTPDSLEIVQVEKQESTALGGDDNDAQPFAVPLDPTEDALEMAGAVFQEVGRRDKSVAVWPDSGKLRFRDSENIGSGLTLTDLASGSGGLNESTHESLDTLTHDINETSYEEITYSGNKVSTVIVWETSAKLKKIREEIYSYSGSKVSQVVIKQYDGSGVLKQTLTDTYTYSGAKISSIDHVRS
jgi:hypothetical protein